VEHAVTQEFEVVETTIDEIHAQMRAGSVTSRRLVEEYLARIEQYDRHGPELNSIVSVNEAALQVADACDRHFRETGQLLGTLHGIPVAVKDQVETEGIPTTFGCIAFKDYVPRSDATIVRRLKASGAVLIAKTSMSDFATSWHGVSSVTGVTKNPYNPDYDPGGSSSGSGAAVAANLATVGIAEDTGGSVRVPASFNNLVGVRVTTGLISRTGLSPLVAWQDTPGPVARTVRDAALLLDVLVGYDPADPLTATVAGSRYVGDYANRLVVGDLRGIRLGVLRESFGPSQDARCKQVNAVVDRAIAELRALGAEVLDSVAIPDFHNHIEATALYMTCAHSDMNEFLAARPDAPVQTIDEVCDKKQIHPLNTFLPAIARQPLRSFDDPGYLRKVVARGTFQNAILNVALANRLDAFVCPSVRIPPPSRKEIFAEGAEAVSADFPTNTEIAPRAWLPAISIPAGFTDDGLPVGLEVIGRPFDEIALLNIALAHEHSTHHRRSPASTPSLSARAEGAR
jgi:amidase